MGQRVSQRTSMLGVQQRGFMKLMAASFGLAGLGITGCEDDTIPYVARNPGVNFGISFFLASMPCDLQAFLLLLKKSQW